MTQGIKTWFITGAARGLGLAVARAAIAHGDRVVATARDPGLLAASLADDGDRVLRLRLDVTDTPSIEAAVAAALSRFGAIDVLVNNAGYGLLGPFEELSPTQIERQFAVNLFGAFAVTRAVLPSMRRRRSGLLIQVASTSGIKGSDLASIYCSSKFALVGWSEALGVELAGFGIRSTAVIAGGFRTDFLDPSSVVHADDAIADYAAAAAAARARRSASNHEQEGDPAAFGRAVVALSRAKEPPARLAAGSYAVEAMAIAAAALEADRTAWRTLSLSTDRERS